MNLFPFPSVPWAFPILQNLFFGLGLNSLYNKRVEKMDQWVKAGTVENRFEGIESPKPFKKLGFHSSSNLFSTRLMMAFIFPRKGGEW